MPLLPSPYGLKNFVKAYRQQQYRRKQAEDEEEAPRKRGRDPLPPPIHGMPYQDRMAHEGGERAAATGNIEREEYHEQGLNGPFHILDDRPYHDYRQDDPNRPSTARPSSARIIANAKRRRAQLAQETPPAPEPPPEEPPSTKTLRGKYQTKDEEEGAPHPERATRHQSNRNYQQLLSSGYGEREGTHRQRLQEESAAAAEAERNRPRPQIQERPATEHPPLRRNEQMRYDPEEPGYTERAKIGDPITEGSSSPYAPEELAVARSQKPEPPPYGVPWRPRFAKPTQLRPGPTDPASLDRIGRSPENLEPTTDLEDINKLEGPGGPPYEYNVPPEETRGGERGWEIWDSDAHRWFYEPFEPGEVIDSPYAQGNESALQAIMEETGYHLDDSHRSKRYIKSKSTGLTRVSLKIVPPGANQGIDAKTLRDLLLGFGPQKIDQEELPDILSIKMSKVKYGKGKRSKEVPALDVSLPLGDKEDYYATLVGHVASNWRLAYDSPLVYLYMYRRVKDELGQQYVEKDAKYLRNYAIKRLARSGEVSYQELQQIEQSVM